MDVVQAVHLQYASQLRKQRVRLVWWMSRQTWQLSTTTAGRDKLATHTVTQTSVDWNRVFFCFLFTQYINCNPVACGHAKSKHLCCSIGVILRYGLLMLWCRGGQPGKAIFLLNDLSW